MTVPGPESRLSAANERRIVSFVRRSLVRSAGRPVTLIISVSDDHLHLLEAVPEHKLRSGR